LRQWDLAGPFVNANRRTLRIAIAAGVSLPALAIAGEALGPQELELPPVPDDWLYWFLPPVPEAEQATPRRIGPAAREELRIQVRDTVLEGTLLAPRDPGRLKGSETIVPPSGQGLSIIRRCSSPPVTSFSALCSGSELVTRASAKLRS
jgi:hypothetical protein